MASTVSITDDLTTEKIGRIAGDEKLMRDRDAEAHNNLGVSYHVQGRVDLAISEYEKALNINPGFADAHSNLGAAYYARREIDLAIKEWQEALRIDPSLAQTHYNLGTAYYYAQGEVPLAIEEWQEALRIDPSEADTYFSLGEVYKAQGKAEKAITYYQRFVELAPLDDAFYIRQAEEQIRQLREMAWREPHDPSETAGRGRALDGQQLLSASAS
jgi:tetratricopeptide (TPR) repeat protein